MQDGNQKTDEELPRKSNEEITMKCEVKSNTRNHLEIALTRIKLTVVENFFCSIGSS